MTVLMKSCLLLANNTWKQASKTITNNIFCEYVHVCQLYFSSVFRNTTYGLALSYIITHNVHTWWGSCTTHWQLTYSWHSICQTYMYMCKIWRIILHLYQPFVILSIYHWVKKLVFAFIPCKIYNYCIIISVINVFA